MPYTLDELYTDEELDACTLTELKDIAEDWEIDISGLKLKADILTELKLYFATERAKAEPASLDDLIDQLTFCPVDKDGKDIKGEFKIRRIGIWKRNGQELMQRSVIAPDGWTGSMKGEA